MYHRPLHLPPLFPLADRVPSQNRELQIMRIVRHPNIVQLKAFYYSNGERVSREITTPSIVVWIRMLTENRKMRST